MSVIIPKTFTPSVKLHPIHLKKIKEGGYRISYTGKAPANSRLLLLINEQLPGVDVTAAPPHDLLHAANLPAFLACIGNLKLWGQEAGCRLFAVQGGQTSAISNGEKLACPVRPYVGRLGPELGRPDSGPKLNYTGVQDGRMLAQPAIDGCHYFAYGGHFETSNDLRGLNCITYAGAVFGVDPASGALRGNGAKLSDYLRAEPCGLEMKTGVEIKQFFSEKPHGTYLVWNAHHVVVLWAGKVYEFSQSHHGFRVTPIPAWHFASPPFWVRRTPKQF
jgi:hypothetical protein